LLLSSVEMLVAGNCCPTNVPAGCAPIRTTWVPITIGQNLYTQYHKLLFPEGFDEWESEDDCKKCGVAFDFSATYRFVQSANACQIAQALWGAQNLIFQGADVDTRAKNALVAEYFGMGPGTDAGVTFCPRLRNQVVDFQLAISGAKFWAQINLPLTWAKWQVTKTCGAPSVTGNYDTGDLDGDTVTLTTNALTVQLQVLVHYA